MASRRQQGLEILKGRLQAGRPKRIKIKGGLTSAIEIRF